MARFGSRGGGTAVATCPENPNGIRRRYENAVAIPFDRSLIQDRCRNNGRGTAQKTRGESRKTIVATAILTASRRAMIFATHVRIFTFLPLCAAPSGEFVNRE